MLDPRWSGGGCHPPLAGKASPTRTRPSRASSNNPARPKAPPRAAARGRPAEAGPPGGVAVRPLLVHGPFLVLLKPHSVPPRSAGSPRVRICHLHGTINSRKRVCDVQGGSAILGEFWVGGWVGPPSPPPPGRSWEWVFKKGWGSPPPPGVTK